MARPSKKSIARAIVRRYPRSYAEQLRLNLPKNKPAPLYRWLIASLLFSARIPAETAMEAASALFAQGWRTPEKMLDASWAQRVRVLNRAGYARYDESTSRYIAVATERLLERYGGDLRRLREDAGEDPGSERKLLKQFKGIGDVGVDIFFRDVQVGWDELYPFADRKALDVAKKVGLGSRAQDLARLVGKRDLPRLLSGLVRLDLSNQRKDFLASLR